MIEIHLNSFAIGAVVGCVIGVSILVVTSVILNHMAEKK